MQHSNEVNKQMIKGLINFSLLILYCAGIFWLSNQPSLPAPKMFSHQDKLFHAGAYFVMAILAWRSFATFIDHPVILALVSVAFCILYGGSDEWHQSFIPGRYASFADWFADTVGAVLGVCLLIKINFRKANQATINRN